MAHKLVYYAVALAPFALVFFLCRGYFPGWPEPRRRWRGVRRLAGDGVPAGLLPGSHDGLIGFWFLEVSSLLFVYMLFNFFLRGTCFRSTCCPAPVGYDRAG